MGWFILAHIFSTLLMFMRIGRLSEQEKDLEILLLRHQLSILERKCYKPVRPTRVEKLTLTVLANRLKHTTNQTARELRGIIRIFQPETVLRWHRELVRRKWCAGYLTHPSNLSVRLRTCCLHPNGIPLPDLLLPRGWVEHPRFNYRVQL